MFAYCVSAAVSRSRFRGASQAPALRVTSSAHGCGRRILSRSLALPHPRDMAPFIPLWNECRRHFGLAGPRAERSAWSWTSTLEIRPDLDHDEIAGWRRRGHRDEDRLAGPSVAARTLRPVLDKLEPPRPVRRQASGVRCLRRNGGASPPRSRPPLIPCWRSIRLRLTACP